jgi:hypothetical protein
MRCSELRAATALCPLTLSLACALGLIGCDRVVQPIGAYEIAAQPVVPVRPQLDAGDGLSTPSKPIEIDAGGVGAAMAPPPVDHHDAAVPPWTIGTSDPTADAGAPYVPPDPSCLPTTSLPATKKRLDMYLVMDANVTLPYTGLWEFTTAGLRAFVMDPRSAGIGVGLRFFGLECDPDAYDLHPTVEVDLLPNNANAIAAATTAPTNFNTSPMAPALQGGINHQQRRATAHPDWKQVVVLLSDGVTEDISCVYTAQDLESEAASGFIGPPSIETYVLGYGFPATPMIANDIIARFSPLDSIASSGGTAQAITVSSSGDPAMMNEALHQIRRTAHPCTWCRPNSIRVS